MVLPFLAVYLTQELRYDYTQAGLAMSCFGAGSFLGSYVGGWLADRVGYSRVMIGSLVLGGGLFFVLMQVHSLPLFCLMLFVLSAVCDAFRPANFVAVSANSHPENRTRSMSLIRMAANLGFGIGPAVGGLVAFHLGYPLLFVVDGLSCIGAGLACFLLLPKEKKETPAVLDAPMLDEKPSAPISAPSPYRDGPFLLFMLFMVFNAIAFMQLFNSLPVYFKEVIGLNEDLIGWLMALNGLLIVAVEMPLVYLFENKYKAFFVVAMGMVLVGLSYIAFPLFGPFLAVAFFSMLLITFGEIAAFPFSNSFVMSRAVEGNRGRYMGAYSMAFAVAHIISPSLGLYLAGTFGFNFLWSVMGLLSCLAGVGVWAMGRREA